MARLGSTTVYGDLTVNGRIIGKGEMVCGSATFNSTTGVTLNHPFANIPYNVLITPTKASGGTLGEYYVIKNPGTSTCVVYNTGTSRTTTFDYVIVRI